MRKIIAIIIFILVSLPIVSASYISITTTVKSGAIFNKTTNLFVSIEQSGDEAAYEVSVVPILPNYFSYDGSLSKQRLDPQKKLEGNFTINLLNKILPGQYPAVLKVIYHDANMYPFSTISPYLITYKERVNSEVYGTISDIEITKEGSGNLILNIRNLDEVPHNINVNLYLPNELKSDDLKRSLIIGPKEEKQIKYKVSSFGALPGSGYSVLVSLEYEENGYQYSTFARGLVKIVEKKENPHFLWFLIVLFAALLLVFIYFKWGRKHE